MNAVSRLFVIFVVGFFFGFTLSLFVIWLLR